MPYYGPIGFVIHIGIYPEGKVDVLPAPAPHVFVVGADVVKERLVDGERANVGRIPTHDVDGR